MLVDGKLKSTWCSQIYDLTCSHYFLKVNQSMLVYLTVTYGRQMMD